MERCSVLQDTDVLAHKRCTSLLKSKFIPAWTFVSIKLRFDIHTTKSLHLVFLSCSYSTVTENLTHVKGMTLNSPENIYKSHFIHFKAS